MGGGNPLSKLEDETKRAGRNIGKAGKSGFSGVAGGLDKAVNAVKAVEGWDSNDWMTAIGTGIALSSGYGAYGAYGTTAGVTAGQMIGMVGGLTLAQSGQQGRAADKAQEEAGRAEQQAMADARALQDRLEQEDYLMRLQSGVDSKTSKGSKTKYGTGSNVSMTAQDLLIPIVNDTTKKTQPIGLGF